ncbi:unnamed protein product [Cuscuta campestris]|uniref:Uncharacterized protein n=1 Tax=Cuscuta campestris TaxID=132261 RepID=A0A484NGB8_9ASTE|nr:unnamed protein product [Cuscuta campestris]
MEDDRDGFSPFWAQGDTGLRRSDRVRRRVESSFFSSGILVFLLLLCAILFLLFIVQHSSGSVFRPSDVKKSWDSLNILLVFLAIVFGLLGKNKNELQKSNPSTPNWYGYRDDGEARRSDPQRGVQQWAETSNRSSFGAGGGASGGLRRTFGSHPDLYEMSPRWVSADDQWRFVDDTFVNASRFYDSPHLYRRRSWKDVDRIQEPGMGELSIKEEKKDPAPPPPSPPPRPPQQAPVEEPTFKDVGKDRDYDFDSNNPTRPPASSPPPPPPPPPPPQYGEPNSSKSGRKRGGSSATKEFILNSLSHKRKRKYRSKSVEDLDALIHTSQSPPLHSQLPSPPKPPAPSVFHNLFNSKKSKRKKDVRPTPTQRIPHPPPPPPPPPPARPPPPRASRNPTVSKHRAAPGGDKEKIVLIVEDKPNIGGVSPLIPIPPPPPPPPFSTKPAWKFVVKGGYARIDSFVSSRSDSPEPEDSDVTPTASEAGGERNPFPPSPLFCPSPDVDTKAENFISKFRAGLKLEKMNSVKMQGFVGPSNLGPTAGSN